jgi:hypothetical protein
VTELAVLVPVLDRPQNVGPLVASFVDGCPDGAHLFFICSTDDRAERDECEKWTMAEENVFWTHHPTRRSWPQKINLGVSYYDDADWFLLGADDIRFTPGWWEATEALRADPSVGVIGTNDSVFGTGNPAVAAGEHTCHPLVRASYIRERGIWGEPGKAVCEEYRHWFVDNELVVTAKLRDAWAFCREAVVEHLHPYWGHGAWDSTYELGQSSAFEDQKVWERRAVEFGPLVAGNPH